MSDRPQPPSADVADAVMDEEPAGLPQLAGRAAGIDHLESHPS